MSPSSFALSQSPGWEWAGMSHYPSHPSLLGTKGRVKSEIRIEKKIPLRQWLPQQLLERRLRSGSDFENPGHIQVNVMATVAWFSQRLGQCQEALTLSQHKKSKLNSSEEARDPGPGVPPRPSLPVGSPESANQRLSCKMPSYCTVPLELSCATWT